MTMTLPAGRELDALVAEKVMGKDLSVYPEHLWRKHENGEIDRFALDSEPHNGPRCTRCGFSYCVHCNETIEPCTLAPLYYSTDIAASCFVMEHIGMNVNDPNGPVRLWEFHQRSRSGKFLARIRNAADDATLGMADGDTLMHAICLAALQAVGG